MYNVTVIFTRHDEEGKCNARELLKIVMPIQPEVIFEELSYTIYDQLYIQQNRTTLESDVVKLYSATYTLEHIPVDTFECPDGYYSMENHFRRVLGDHIFKSVEHRRAFDQLVSPADNGGFSFLNNDQNDVMMDALEAQENSILAGLADKSLNQIAQLIKEVNSKRDEVMIDNIYKFAAEQVFQTGIFLIGAGHRRSIKSKLDKITPRHGVEIKWHFLSE